MVLKKGEEVVLSTQEHPAALKPWIHRGAKDGVILKYVYIPSPLVSKQDTINRLMSAVSSKTKAISFCHVTRGGHKYPVKEIAYLARRKGIATLVDGAQAVGQFPIDIKNLIINKEFKKYEGLTFLDAKKNQLNLNDFKGNLILLNF